MQLSSQEYKNVSSSEVIEQGKGILWALALSIKSWWSHQQKVRASKMKSDFSIATCWYEWGLIWFVAVFLCSSPLEYQPVEWRGMIALSISIFDKATGKCASCLFLIALGKLSFVNLLWLLNYLVCIILTGNFEMQRKSFLIILVLLCVCVCLFLSAGVNGCMCNVLVAWM